MTASVVAAALCLAIVDVNAAPDKGKAPPAGKDKGPKDKAPAGKPAVSGKNAPPANRATTSSLAKLGLLAPLKDKAAYQHSPFTEGECKLCHKNKDPRTPVP